MNNFMKLFSILVIFIQLQVAFSQTSRAHGPGLIQQLCKRNRYQSLCISTLSTDPRSKTSDLQGLVSISVDATSKKVNETLQYLISVLKTIVTPGDFERYGTCIDQDYGASVDRFLPSVLADLKAKKYALAMTDMKDVVSASDDCEMQFAGMKSPLTGRNKAIHDIADMTADIIKTFIK